MALIDRKPKWLIRKLPDAGKTEMVYELLSDLGLHTVCQEAECPNQGECYGKGTATFLLLGPLCTRNCTFCAVGNGRLTPPDAREPSNVAAAVQRLQLRYCVLTMVTRDDLTDGGADHVSETIGAIRNACPATRIEVLISDLGGSGAALNRVLSARPDVLNHNLETIPRLYPSVRPAAVYDRSLKLLETAGNYGPRPVTKSGLMLGVGENEAEVLAAMQDLRSSGCDVLTLGQYLAPSRKHHPVDRYVPPAEFDRLAQAAEGMGFKGVASGPYVRSSYNAEALYQKSRLS